jgi:membrane fusion protein, multidrug efflux system
VIRARVASALGALALAAAFGCGAPDVEPAEPSAPVEFSAVSVGPIEETTTAFGTIEFDPDRTQVLPFTRAGKVVRVAVVAGQPVAKGDLLVEVGAMPAESPDARRARIDVDFAEREVARLRRLVAEQLATNADLEAAEKNLEASRATVEGLGGGARGGHTTALRAGEDSVVVEVMATAGSLVQAGQSALSLAARGAVVARMGFEPDDMPRLREGIRVRLEPLFGDGSAQPVEGYVSRLNQGVNPATQLVELLLRVDAPPGWMVTGTKVRGAAVTRRSERAVLVSNDALLERAGKAGAFVVEDGRARWRPVELGIVNELNAEARAGLQPGERVVTAGRTSLEEGMRVRGPGTPESE